MLQLGFLKLLHGAAMREEPEEFPCVFSEDPPYEVQKTPWLLPEELDVLRAAEDAEAAILAAWPLDTELPAGISAVQGRLQTVDLPGKYPHVLIVEQSAPVKAAGK